MQHFVDKCNLALAEKLQKHKGEMIGLRTTERVRTAIQWRLEMIIPHMSMSYLFCDCFRQPCTRHILIHFELRFRSSYCTHLIKSSS